MITVFLIGFSNWLENWVNKSEWDVSATPIRRRQFGDTVSAMDSSAIGQFGDRTVRRWDSLAPIL